MRYGFYFNADECLGCKTCMMACKDIHDLQSGLSYRRVYNIASGKWEKDENGAEIPVGVYSYSVSMACNHCENPACISVCPQHAIRKENNGIVWIDPDKCVGCRLCAGKCPHGAIQFNREKGVSEKCDMCRKRLEKHQEPACVAACPMRCLKIIDMDQFQLENDEETKMFPIGSMTQPSFYLHLNRKIGSKANNNQKYILNMAEEL